MTDEEKIARLQEEKQKLMEQLALAQEETKKIENELEKKSSQTNNMGDDQRRWGLIILILILCKNH